MRARSLKPRFFTDPDLLAMPPVYRIFFEGLWCVADREGRFLDEPERLRFEILPADQVSGPEMMDALAQVGKIVRYEIEGKRYACIPGFPRQQSPHHTERASVLPAPPTVNGDVTVDSPEVHRSVTVNIPPDSLTPRLPEIQTHTSGACARDAAPQAGANHIRPDLPEVAGQERQERDLHIGLARQYYAGRDASLYIARNCPQPEAQEAIRIWEQTPGTPRLAPGERKRMECAVLTRDVYEGIRQIAETVAGNEWLRTNWGFARACKPANATQILNGEYTPDGQAPKDTDALASRVWERAQQRKREREQRGVA